LLVDVVLGIGNQDDYPHLLILKFGQVGVQHQAFVGVQLARGFESVSSVGITLLEAGPHIMEFRLVLNLVGDEKPLPMQDSIPWPNE